MGAVMLIVAVSRGAKVPVYLRDLGWMNLDATAERMLNHVSFWALIAALLTAGLIITGAMVKGMIRVRSEERQAAAEEIATNG
jgi:hypothetical protein